MIEHLLFLALCVVFVYRLATKWNLFDLWDTYIPIKRCMFCLSWWISIICIYLFIHKLSNPFCLTLKDIFSLVTTAMASTTLILFFYEKNR